MIIYEVFNRENEIIFVGYELAPMAKKLLTLVILFFSTLAIRAQNPPDSHYHWKERVATLHKLAKAQKVEELKQKLSAWRTEFEHAPCEAKVSWILLSLDFNVRGVDRSDLVRQLKQLRSCTASDQRYSLHTVVGADYYERGVYDSTFYSFSASFAESVDRSDTNQMVLALSNLAALYSEMDWKVEALASALRAYSLAQSSNSISAQTNLFLENNVASLQMDMGYFDRAASVLEDFELDEDELSEGYIHVLRGVNYARLKIHEARGSERKMRKILEQLDSSPAAFMMASSFAVADSLCPASVLDYIHDQYLVRQDELVRDTAIFVAFGVPALGGISLERRIDESLRQRASSLRDWVAQLNIGGDRLGYKLAIAQMFEIPDYWEDYWRETERVKRRDQGYARLQNKLLSDFNEQVQLETSAIEELESKRLLVQMLILVAGGLLGIAIGLLYWINGRYKVALRNHKFLVAENERMTRGMVTQFTYMDELKELTRKSGKSIRSEALKDLLDRMEESQPHGKFDLPESVLKEFDLTATEAKVLMQLAYGYRNAEIVQMLNISKSYIHNVRSKLRQKLPLNPDEELEDFAVALRKSYEPTSLPESARFSR